MIINIDNSFITIIILPYLEIQVHESKPSVYKELYISKYTAHIEASIVDNIAFIFPISTILSDTMSMLCNGNFIFYIRYRQTRKNNMIRYYKQYFPEKYESFYTYHMVS